MSKNKKIIYLSVLSILIVAVLVISITYSFMRQSIDTSSITEVSLSSCAKITLTDNSSIDLSNTYPMSRNKALQTTPYTFTVTSSCDTYVGFNLYLATLASNTLSADAIHYVITEVDSKEALAEGILSDAPNVTSEFSDAEITEYNVGTGGTVGNIYQLFNASIPLKGSISYDLYLYVDESITNETVGLTFNAGVAVRSYDREKTFAEACTGENMASCIIENYKSDGSIYYHDENLENGAEDYSYRYAGKNYELTNQATAAGYTKIVNDLITYYCGGTLGTVGGNSKTNCLNASPLDYDDKYYIVANESTHYLTYDEALYVAVEHGYLTSNVNNFVCFGTLEEVCPIDNLYRIIGFFDDDRDGVYQIKLIKNALISNTSDSYLNETFLNSIEVTYQDMIENHTWSVGGMDYTITDVAKQYLDSEMTYEIVNDAKIGLMYVNDYGFAAEPTYWTTALYNYSLEMDWVSTGLEEWTITPVLNGAYVNTFSILSEGSVHVITTYWGPDGVEYDTYIRPTFYLKSDVKMSSGSGTFLDPYRIN